MNFFLRQILLSLCCCIYICSIAQYDTSFGHRPDEAPVNKDTSNLVLIADIAIHGNKKTKPYIIEREIPFKQGQYILRRELDKQIILAQQQIFNTSLFTEASVFIATQSEDLVFITVDVKERWYLFPLPYFKLVDRNFNQWWVEEKRSFERVNYGIKFMQNNVSGRNDKLNIWLISGYSRQINLKYEQPFVNSSLTTGFSMGFSYARQRELNYATDLNKQIFFKQEDFVKQTIKAEIAYLYRPAIKTRHTFQIGYVNDIVGDTIIKLNRNYHAGNKPRISFPEFFYMLQYFNTDYNAYPRKGFMGDFSLLRLGWNSDMNMTQVQFHGTYTIPVFPKTQMQFQAGGLLKLPFDQPFSNQQLLGYGDIFLRGLEYYVIDGVAGIVGRATAKREIFSFILKTPEDSKKNISIPFSFFVKLYGDIGYGYNKNPGNNPLNNTLLRTWGFGLDIVTTYDLVIKLDYSFNQIGGKGLFLHLRTDF